MGLVRHVVSPFTPIMHRHSLHLPTDEWQLISWFRYKLAFTGRASAECII